MEKKRKAFGIARVAGKTHYGDLSDVPGVQTMVGIFHAKAEERSKVVMVRLSDGALESIDQLVESTLAGSRSEAASLLINAGIESQKELFERLAASTGEIRRLKEQLRQIALDAVQPRGSGRKGGS